MALGPKKIHEVMDLAWTARTNGDTFNVMLKGEAGLGKSEVLQQWAQKKREEFGEFHILDLRLAYLESPDIIGFPKEVQHDGRWRTIHALPGFWPVDPDSKGMLLLEEINRGTTGVMNTMMQLLTDRKILSDDPSYPDYILPDGWIICAAVNPDSAQYDVNSMDQALSDRFVQFDVGYNHNEFVKYIKQQEWHRNVVNYIQSGAWTYKESGSIARDNSAMYISPRTWSRVNAAERAGAGDEGSRTLHRSIVQALLGKHIGEEYHKMCYDDSPVLASDLIKDFDGAIKKLKQLSKKSSYAGDKVAVTVDSICDSYQGWYEDLSLIHI